MKNWTKHLSTTRFCISDKKGFTLTELLVTVAIIGILAGIAVPMYLGHRAKSMHAEAKSNLETIRLFEEQRFAELSSYGGDNTYTYNGTYGTADTGIEDLLPGFQPGVVTNLYFTYSLVVSGTGTSFTATATGNANTAVAGTVFTIDQNNTKNY